MLHLLCVIGGFGCLAYNGLYLLAQPAARGGGGALEINSCMSALAELLIYAAFVFGLAAVGASHSVWNFSRRGCRRRSASFSWTSAYCMV